VRDRLAHSRPPADRPPRSVVALTGAPGDYDPIVRRAREADYVLLGEASHGTREFYRERAQITRRLIEEEGFSVVAVEADWPDAYRVNRFVRGAGADAGAAAALSDFCRFPRWMWRNTEVAEFVAWLRAYNDSLPAGARKVGFYGLDLYAIYTAMEEVVRYLDDVDPAAAGRARERYACFGQFGRDARAYGRETGLGGAEPCERDAVAQLLELRALAAAAVPDDGELDEDRRFYVEQNARLVVEAERHYRAVFRAGQDSWNLRDRHMAQTLEELVAHARRRDPEAKAVVWEHNTHVGDARATEMTELGQLSVGQLMRERHGVRALIIGFTTYAGSVTAASEWGAEGERKRVRPARPGSWEDVFHELREPVFMVDAQALEGSALQRAIGVVYRPETELVSHYFNARAGEQFDVVIHLDETHAVAPLEPTSGWERGELPDTYPWGT